MRVPQRWWRLRPSLADGPHLCPPPRYACLGPWNVVQQAPLTGEIIGTRERWETPMSLSESEQHALIARFQQGDTTVFDALYASIEQGVYGYILGMLTRDAQEA